MNIGERIRIRREELGMSQEELAIKTGYKSRSSINKIEVDGRGLPQSKIMLFSKALMTTPAYLMGWEKEKEDGKIFYRKEHQELRVLIDIFVRTSKHYKISTKPLFQWHEPIPRATLNYT